MMRAMRANVKWIMGFVAISFVGWMIFEVGMDVTGRGGPTMTDEILRVNGQKIDAQTFYAAVRNVQEQQRQLGSPALTLEDQRDLENQVIERMVEQMLLEREYERRGITVSADEIRQAALTSPPPEVLRIPEFQTEGEFDIAKYQRYLQSQTDPAFLFSLEARYRDELPRAKLFDRLTADVYVSDAKLWQLYRDEHDSVEVRALSILPELAARDHQLQVDAQAIAAHYRDHREQYRRPAQAFMSYVWVSRRPNAADSAAALERTRALIEELRGGADFAALAARESADSATRGNGGDLGEITREGGVDLDFYDAARALRPGRISEPVLTQFGLHIIKLDSKTSESIRARHILIPIEVQGDHLDVVDARGDSLDFLGAEEQDPTALDAVAQTMNLQIQTAPVLLEGERLRLRTPDPRTGAPGPATYVPDVGVWAFEALVGEISPVIEAPRAFYLFRLDSTRVEGVPPLEEVREAVERDALAAKRWSVADSLADAVDADLRGGTSLEDAAATRGLNAVVLPPFTRVNPNPALADSPEAIGVAFGLAVDETSGPIRGERAIFFVQPLARHAADSSAWLEQIEEQRSQIFDQARRLRVQMILASLRRQADVIDRRQDLARAQREQADIPFQTGPLGF